MGEHGRPARWVVLAFAALMAVCVPGLGAAQQLAASSPFDLEGHWEGEIVLPSGALQVMIDFAAGVDGWTGTIDIPVQAAQDLPLIDISVDGPRARFTIAGVPGNPTFAGLFRDGELAGSFTQGAARLDFRLAREAVLVPPRPQDPQPPYPYSAHEVSYSNGELTLAGTLTVPPGSGPFPAAVLLSGSGAQNRNGELFNHRPFQLWADVLTRRGIAVLRSDDRGVGGSGGDVQSATSADFADDALAAVDLLRARADIAADRIGLIGHSEGGLVGPLAASRAKSVAFVVMLAGPGVPGAEILPLQAERMALAAGGAPETVLQQGKLLREIVAQLLSEKDEEKLRTALADLARRQLELGGEAARQALGDDPEAAIDSQIEALCTPWFRFFLAYDPRPALTALEVPVLAVNGSLDLQVVAEQNLPAIRAALDAAGNEDATVVELEGLNHLFQQAVTGTLVEYGQLEQTLAPEVLELVGDWLVERFVVVPSG